MFVFVVFINCAEATPTDQQAAFIKLTKNYKQGTLPSKPETMKKAFAILRTVWDIFEPCSYAVH